MWHSLGHATYELAKGGAITTVADPISVEAITRQVAVGGGHASALVVGAEGADVVGDDDALVGAARVLG